MRWLGVVLVLCGFVLQQFACCANCCAPGELPEQAAVTDAAQAASLPVAVAARAQHRCQHTHHQPQPVPTHNTPADTSHEEHGEHHLCVSSHLFFVLRPADLDLATPWMVTAVWITVQPEFDLNTPQNAHEVSLSLVRSPHPLAERSRLGHWLI